MNSFYHIRHKGKIALLLFFLVCLELLNAISHENNMSEMDDTFSSVYHDRLIAQDYLYKLEEKIYLRKLTFAESIKNNWLDPLINNRDDSSRAIIANYEKTRLTIAERKLINEFKVEMEAILALEPVLLASGNQAYRQELLKRHDGLTDSMLQCLHGLSQIQMEEGRQLNAHSRKIVQFSTILNQFNWTLIIVIGLIILVLVFASKSSIPRLPQNEHLN